MKYSAIMSLVVAVINYGIYAALETLLRKDAVALSRKPTEHDKGTTRFISVIFVASWLLLLLAVVLNQFHIGTIEPHFVFNAVGVVLMAAGVVLRVVAMRTLGKFFTRTLRMREEQHVVSTGIYRRVRHPGYLGEIVLWIGSGLATSNVIPLVLISGAILTAYLRRIAAEERMMAAQLGEEYLAYTARSWKLVPFVF